MMDLATIQMDRRAARKAFLDYRREVEARHRSEDEALMTGYRALSRGHMVISLQQAMADGGVREKADGHHFLPALAICRADHRTVSFDRDLDGGGLFRWGHVEPNWDRRAARYNWQVRIPRGTFIYPERANLQQSVSAVAKVPIVPAALRPGDLSRYFVLWEAEWTQVPPRDPALLRRLGHGLYAVIATWDLTELERAVIGNR